VGGQFTSKALKERDNPESQITEVGCEKISTKFTKSAEKNLIRRFHRFPQMFAKNNNHESTRMNSNQKRRNDHKGTKAPRHQEEQACPADARMSGSYRAGDVVIPDFPWASPRADRTGLSGRRKRRTAPRKTNVVWPGLLALRVYMEWWRSLPYGFVTDSFCHRNKNRINFCTANWLLSPDFVQTQHTTTGYDPVPIMPPKSCG